MKIVRKSTLGAFTFFVSLAFSQDVQAAILETQWSYTCPSGWTSTDLRDDTKNSTRHLGEENTQGAPEPQLCLRSDNPGITITSQWTTSGCSGGNSFTGLYDDAGSWFSSDDTPGRHNLNEDNYRPNGSNAYQWCLGATGAGAAGITARWVTEYSTVHEPSCAADETFLVGSHNFVHNLNYADFNGANQESLCAKINVVNQTPNPPTITGPTTGSTSTNYTFTLNSTDNDGDNVAVGMDWDLNGVVDQWTSPMWTTSGGDHTVDKQWDTPGTYTVRAVSYDNQAYSTWTDHTITIVAAAVPAPTINFTINGSTGPLTVAQGTALNLNWNTAGATSCTAWGASWASGTAIPLTGTTTFSATQSDTYIIQCTGPGGTTISSIDVIIQNTLKICQNSCSSGALRGTPTNTGSFTMVQGGTQNLVACFNSASDCTDPSGDVTSSATWNENAGSNVVSLSGSAPKTVTAGANGTENLSVTYSGQTANTQATVTCVPTYTQSSCATHPEAQNHCQNEGFTISDNGCGVPVSCSGGTKTCDFNWKEVAP